jgi:riboflavin synthase
VVTVDDAAATFTVSLIPETLSRTTLGIKQPGDPVNLEVDVVAKYVERMLEHRSGATNPVEEEPS